MEREPEGTRTDAERLRLHEDARRSRNWKRWGPYLSERQWGTVREDYSADGDAWSYFPHDHARSRAYRWGEDGLLGLCDRECRLCFALAMWNGNDRILKERLFGLSHAAGNHGEDVKECYFYLDSTPTHSYMKALYKYPRAAFPYDRLVEENRPRELDAPELELAETGVFDENRYFDVVAEYAKGSPDDVLIRITVANRGPEAAAFHLIPTLWFRNTWAWGRKDETAPEKPRLSRVALDQVLADHPTLGRFVLAAAPGAFGQLPSWIFTENATNMERLFGAPNGSPWVKDAFHRYIVDGRSGVVNPSRVGTKVGAHYRVEIPAGAQQVFRLRLVAEAEKPASCFGPEFDAVFERRQREADGFYATVLGEHLDEHERAASRQAYAGLLWSKQYYHYVVKDWLEGDPAQPPPPVERRAGGNAEWPHLFNRDVISMPDKWEYPWFAAWDLAFHMVPMAHVDPQFAKDQLVLFLREWYMHPNGQIPAYEAALSDVNPPVHAWSAWRVYKISGPPGARDRLFLERVFHKLLLNFTWWVNRKDPDGKNLFAGGFLGLDNVGVFDRSRPLPGGGHLEQADGTAWMAFYCGTMLSIALELAREDPAYEDAASKFFEHFVAIADAANGLGGTGLWNDEDGFYYDQINVDGRILPLRLRSMVGLLPLIACEVLEEETLQRLPGFAKRMRWFLENRADLARHIAYMECSDRGGHPHRLLALPSRERLERVLRPMLDEREFLSPHGIRSLSAAYRDRPYEISLGGVTHEVRYAPAESRTALFGGNSNWRGPIWFPTNYLLIEALERYHHFYGGDLQVECPTGSGHRMTLHEVAQELATRLARLFLPDASGRRPCHGDDPRYAVDPHWRDLALFHECFDGDQGRGVGASHQTGWTALAIRCIEEQARRRRRAEPSSSPMGLGGLEPAGFGIDAAEFAKTVAIEAAPRRHDTIRTRTNGEGRTDMTQGMAEWLETDGLGGFASGTVSGIRTRRYHALLLAATMPPTGRVALVNGLEAWVQTRKGRYALSTHRYAPDVLHPDGQDHIESFETTPWPTWTFRLPDGTRIRHEIFLRDGLPLACLSWRLIGKRAGVTLEARPLLSGRDAHGLHRENAAFRFDPDWNEGTLGWRPYPDLPAILAHGNAEYRHAPDWYRGFLYSEERERGLDDQEDLAAPGTLSWDLSRREAALILAADNEGTRAVIRGHEASQALSRLRNAEKRRRRFTHVLERAADAYLVRRGAGRTIVAGYPWFTDWGRDTFIALRGLCLAGGRIDDARRVLLEWSDQVSEGMLPNRFVDQGGHPEYNSVDASLWFVVAVYDFLRTAESSKKRPTAKDRKRLLSAVEAILDGYRRGTRYGIRMEPDGLLACGEPGVALTWMDAKTGEHVVTTRIGKPVEIQALWLNALRIARELGLEGHPAPERGQTAFAERFWHEEANALYDVVDVDHEPAVVDPAFRPNQLFAIGGLPFPILEGERARRVVDGCERRLWTPLGPRSLAPGEDGYAPAYHGGLAERDAAYHQGTVWPWLAGPFVEAWVRVRGGGDDARREARARFLEPLLRHVGEVGLGHVSEIADAESPFTPRGCPFQAWSVGELMRLDRVVLAEGVASPAVPIEPEMAAARTGC